MHLPGDFSMNIKTTGPVNGGDFQQTLERGVDAAATAAHSTIDSASKAARPALDSMVSGAHGAVDRLGVAATQAAGTLGVKGDQLNQRGERIADQARGYVREHPVASLGMAVATGYLLSRLFSSR
jgi:ElaB/YqjD/DUF883 family membrane-anchored ribosome-binding protein